MNSIIFAWINNNNNKQISNKNNKYYIPTVQISFYIGISKQNGK